LPFLFVVRFFNFFLKEQSSSEIFTNPKNDFDLERSRFLDLRRDSHTSEPEAEKHPSFSIKNFFIQKPDLLSQRISDFIQKNFLLYGEHHDRLNRTGKPFQLLERYCLTKGYDYNEKQGLSIARVSQIFLKE
jgi:hypothetical protein